MKQLLLPILLVVLTFQAKAQYISISQMESLYHKKLSEVEEILLDKGWTIGNILDSTVTFVNPKHDVMILYNENRPYLAQVSKSAQFYSTLLKQLPTNGFKIKNDATALTDIQLTDYVKGKLVCRVALTFLENSDKLNYYFTFMQKVE